VTKAAFDQYRINKYNPNADIVPWQADQTLPNNVASGNVATTRNSELADWNKAIKPSKNDYKVLKDEAYWPRYKETTGDTIQAHGLEHLIDPSIPVLNQELDLRQRKWLYKVFTDIFQAPSAKAIVIKHKASKDTRLIWKEIVEKLDSSMTTEIRADSIGSWIMSAKLHLLNWRGSQESAILHFQEQCRIYNEMKPKDQFSNLHMVSLLQQFISGTENLKNVLTHWRTATRATGNIRSITFEEFVALLQDQAAIHDGARGRPRNPRLNANVHDHLIEFDDQEVLQVNHEVNVHDAYDIFDEDNPFRDEFNCYVTDSSTYPSTSDPPTRKVMMNRATWMSLTSSDQQNWDTISDQGKNKILTYAQNRGNPSNATQNPSSQNGNFQNRNNSSSQNSRRIIRQANEHEVTASEKQEEQEPEPQLEVSTHDLLYMATHETKLSDVADMSDPVAHRLDMAKWLSKRQPTVETSTEPSNHEVNYREFTPECYRHEIIIDGMVMTTDSTDEEDDEIEQDDEQEGTIPQLQDRVDSDSEDDFDYSDLPELEPPQPEPRDLNSSTLSEDTVEHSNFGTMDISKGIKTSIKSTAFTKPMSEPESVESRSFNEKMDFIIAQGIQAEKNSKSVGFVPTHISSDEKKPSAESVKSSTNVNKAVYGLKSAPKDSMKTIVNQADDGIVPRYDHEAKLQNELSSVKSDKESLNDSEFLQLMSAAAAHNVDEAKTAASNSTLGSNTLYHAHLDAFLDTQDVQATEKPMDSKSLSTLESNETHLDTKPKANKHIIENLPITGTAELGQFDDLDELSKSLSNVMIGTSVTDIVQDDATSQLVGTNAKTETTSKIVKTESEIKQDLTTVDTSVNEDEVIELPSIYTGTTTPSNVSNQSLVAPAPTPSPSYASVASAKPHTDPDGFTAVSQKKSKKGRKKEYKKASHNKKSRHQQLAKDQQQANFIQRAVSVGCNILSPDKYKKKESTSSSVESSSSSGSSGSSNSGSAAKVTQSTQDFV
jgi:hypothetical protein